MNKKFIYESGGIKMRSKKLKLMVGALLVTMVGATFVGCGSNESAEGDKAGSGAVTISISGSTSVGPLMEKVQEIYEEENSNVTLEIQQNGSGAGIKDVIGGVSEIGMSSRELKDEEKGSVEGTTIAYDGIALLVNPNNTVKNISLEDVKKIYTGEITNWKDLGGEDAPIVVVSREEGSGTRGAFVELLGVVDENENDITVSSAQITNSTSVMLQKVAQTKSAIGYVSLGSLSTDVKAVQVDGADATAENVKSGNYKVSRPFNICYKEDKLSDIDKDFISFIMSKEGQQIVNDNGYIGVEATESYKASGKKGKITLAGSTSVAPLMDKLKDEYVKLNADASIEIQESGSSAGIQSAIEGATEIGMSSRELKDEEAKELQVQKIALDGIAVIVNTENQVTNLTSDQIKKIYTGDLTDWADVQ